MLKSSLWDYSDAYIPVKGTITLIEQGAVAPAIKANSKVIEKEIRIAAESIFIEFIFSLVEFWVCLSENSNLALWWKTFNWMLQDVNEIINEYFNQNI